ncbi:MAG: hypothetical protein HC921_14900 [Synechococcaceae cyanobacterium SM2_3_1]|nr:hypothetical protein [Synechococcaceae cyanobacterium SM2_3_1]
MATRSSTLFPNPDSPQGSPLIPGSQPDQDLPTSPDLPLGQRLVKAGLLTQAQLAQALREQQQTHMKLGEVCMQHGWLTPADLYSFTSSQELSLGEILVALGYLELDQLRVALAQQRRFGRKLGEILVWKGWLQVEDLNEALQIQDQLQGMNAENAWDALQAMLNPPEVDPEAAVGEGAHPEAIEIQPEVEADPIPREDTVPLPQSLPPQELDPALMPPPPVRLPSSPGLDYQNQIAALELQLHMREREWEAFVADMNQQIEEYQQQYLHRIHQLEARLRERDAELQQIRRNRDTEVEQLRHRAERIEQELQLERSQAQQNQEKLHQQTFQHGQKVGQLQVQIETLQQQLNAALQADQSEAVALERQQLQAQIQQLQTEQEQAQERIQELQEQLTTTSLEPHPEQNATLKAALEAAQARQAVTQTRLSFLEEQHDITTQELEQSRQLLHTYRQTIESLQHNLKIQQQQNQILQTSLDQQRHRAETTRLDRLRDTVSGNGLSATSASPQPLPVQSETDPGTLANTVTLPIPDEPPPEDPIPKPVLTPWARNLFFHLQEAGLITDQDMEQVLTLWQQKGGRLTQVLADHTGLQQTTVKFFSDGGYTARLSGSCHRIGDYLQAAGLVSEEQIQTVITARPEGQLLGEALVDQGYLSAAAADYFVRHFVSSSFSGDNS